MTKPSVALDVAVYAAFGDTPFDTTTTGVDITAAVAEWEITRGRTSPLQRFNAGTLTVTLDDTAGDFDQLNTGGAYAGDLRTNLHLWVEATPDATPVELGHGYVDTWGPLEYLDPGSAIVTVTASDLAKFLELYDGGGPGTAGAWPAGLTGDRIVDVLDQVGIPSAWRDIDPGQNLLVARPAPGSVNGIAEAQLAVGHEAPWAALFATRTNEIRFDDASSIALNTRITTRQATLSKLPADLATAVNPRRMPFAPYNALVRTRAEVTIPDGTIATATAGGTAVADYGLTVWSENLDQLVASPNVAQGIADAVIVMYGEERYGPRSADIKVLAPGAAVEDLLTLELRDRVRVKHTAPAGHSIDVDAFVEGITIRQDLDGVIHVRLTLSAAEFTDSLNPTDWLIWDTGSWDVDKWGYVA